MAGAGTKRIVDLTETSEVQSGDYIAIDSTARGTKKTPVSVFAKAADLSAEQTARQTADATLDGKITAETQDRLAAENAIGEQITALSGEVTAQGELIQNPTKTVSGAIVHFTDGAEMPAKSMIVNIEPQQSGTGTPSPDNVRPISGWDEVETAVSGKNLLPPKFYSGIGYNGAVGTVYTLTDITDTFTETDGVFSKSVSAWGGASMVSEALPNGSYRINVALTSSSLRLTGYILDADYKVIRQFDLIGSGTSYSENRTITLSDSETYIALYVASSVSGSISFGQPQLELGTTATSYEPYTGTTTPVNLGRTVYGGTLDVVSGVLTVTHAIRALDGTEQYADYWSLSSTNRIGVYITDSRNTEYTNFWCSHYGTYSFSALADNGIAKAQSTNTAYVIKDSVNCLSVNGYKAYVAQQYANGAPITLVYELATPQTYQLTPTEVKTLLGENNVWADAGAVNITYRRDINLALEQLEALLNS